MAENLGKFIAEMVGCARNSRSVWPVNPEKRDKYLYEIRFKKSNEFL